MMPPPETTDRPTWAEARDRSYAATTAGRASTVPLAAAIGRRLAGDVVALCDLPHYPSAAMDGWAVNGAPPWTVVGTDHLRTGQCRVIVTGELIPHGATAVLRSEHAARNRVGGTDQVSPSEAARADEPRNGEHIRPIGTEAHRGDALIRSGTLLNPADIALVAAAGHDALFVYERPRVRLVLTGDEIVVGGVPPNGRVRDSFGPTLPWLVASLGGVASTTLHVPDSAAALREALSGSAGDHEIVVSTGGTGHSRADHLHSVIEELGAILLVDGIRMRPGGPSILARFPDGRILVGLPGNPRAAMLALITLAGPLLAAMTGGPKPQTTVVRVGTALPGRPDTSLLVPYLLENGVAVPTGWAGSGMMRGLAASAGVLVCPPGGILADGEAEAFSLPWVAPDGGRA
jgi:molybdopterin molybdotransferase